MDNRNRDQQNPADAFDDNQDKNKRPLNDDKIENVSNETGGLVDLDGDGFIGNTGGFYGGTSYLGSNYGEDWNKAAGTPANEGNFGAAGQQDAGHTMDDKEAGLKRDEDRMSDRDSSL